MVTMGVAPHSVGESIKNNVIKIAARQVLIIVTNLKVSMC